MQDYRHYPGTQWRRAGSLFLRSVVAVLACLFCSFAVAADGAETLSLGLG